MDVVPTLLDVPHILLGLDDQGLHLRLGCHPGNVELMGHHPGGQGGPASDCWGLGLSAVQGRVTIVGGGCWDVDLKLGIVAGAVTIDNAVFIDVGW